MVVLSVQQEVGPDDGHAHRHNRQDDEHQQHEAVHIVHLHISTEGLILLQGVVQSCTESALQLGTRP